MTGDKSSSIQDEFFHRARREAHPVTIFLTNGKKLQGRIRSFDKFTVLVEINRQEQMIFKHAISTVAIGRPVHDKPGPEGLTEHEPEPDADAPPST